MSMSSAIAIGYPARRSDLKAAILRAIGERNQVQGGRRQPPTKIQIKDAEGHYTLVNPVAEKLFGVTDEEVRGKSTYDIFPKEVADAFTAHDRAVADSGETVEQTEEFTREDGAVWVWENETIVSSYIAYPSFLDIGDSFIARIGRLHITPSPRFSYSSILTLGGIMREALSRVLVAR